MGLCLWSGSGLGSNYVCVCGFVLVVRISWVKAWFGMALLLTVVVGCGGGVGFFVGCHWVFLLLNLWIC